MSTGRTVKRVRSKVSVAEDVAPLRMSRRQDGRNVGDDPNRSEFHRSNFLSQYSQLIEDKDTSLTMYFVVPEGKTRATCHSKLPFVYAMCEELKLHAQWINEADCLKFEPKVGNIFVMAPFEGPAFEYLEQRRKNLQFEIVGPQCIHYGISKARETMFSIQNEGFSTYTMAMRGVLVCMTGISGKEKQNLRLKILRMGGHDSNLFTNGVTHVVAEKLITPKCDAAFKTNIPVMKSEWIHKVWNDSEDELVHATDEKYVKYTCPVFYNLVICVSQISQSLKLSYKKIIEAHGGTYSAELKKDTSILIVPSKGSEKFKAAQNWKIPCVMPAWVDDSKSAGHILRYDDYYVDIEIKKVIPTSTPMHSMVQPPPGGGVAKFMGMNDSVLSCVDGIRGNITEASHVHEESELNTVAPALDTRALELAASIGPYLDGCAIYVSGNSQLEKLKKHINTAGAIHLSTLTKSVTHILATDNKISSIESDRIKQLHIKPYIVNLKWLVASAKKGSPEDEDIFPAGGFSPEEKDSLQVISETFLSNKSCGSSGSTRSNNESMKSNASSKRTSLEAGKKRSNEKNSNENRKTPSPNSTGGSNDSRRQCSANELLPGIVHEVENGNHLEARVETVTNAQSLGSAQNHRENNKSLDLQDPQEEYEAEARNGDEEYTAGDDESQKVYIFTDKKIKLVLHDEDELEEVTSAVQNSDGEVVTGSDFDYIVLPPVCDSKLLAVQDETKCVTKYWVFDSMDCSKLISLKEMKFHHKPFRMYQDVHTVMTEIVIAITQYSHTEKAFLSTLVTTMGGTYQDAFARRASKKTDTVASTHLICPNTNNDKYRAACKWGTPVVMADWLIDSFLQKKRMPEASYNPELASDSDSQSQGSYIMPQTPKVNWRVSTQTENRDRTSACSVMPSSADKAQCMRTSQVFTKDDSPFKTPTSLAKKSANKKPAKWQNSSEIIAEMNQDPGFLEYLEQQKAANGGTMPEFDIDAYLAKNDTPNFRAYRAEQRALRGLPPEDQPSIVIEGMTTEEARDFRIALETAGANTPPPNLKKKKKPPTPVSVMMARTWKQLMEKFPVDDVPLTSTPKAANRNSSANSSVSSIESASKLQGRNGVKRGSDSSVEDDMMHGGKNTASKRLRISSESDSTDISEIIDDQEKSGGAELNVKQFANHRQLSDDEDSELPLPLGCLVVWISEDCNVDDIKLEIEKLGGQVVADFQNTSITHIIVEVETQSISEAQERNKNLKIVKPSWITACKATGMKIDEDGYKSIPSSKGSALALADMLKLNDADGCGMHLQKQKKNRNNYSSTGNGEETTADDAMNPEEYDAPAVVWDDEDAIEPRRIARKELVENENRLKSLPQNIRDKELRNRKTEDNDVSEANDITKTCSRTKPQHRNREKLNAEELRANKTPASSSRRRSSKASARSHSKEKLVEEDAPKQYSFSHNPPKFLLSGVEDLAKKSIEDCIKKLGGIIVESSTFVAEADALITMKLARSEKVLASIAAGKFVLKVAYLESCSAADKFVPITEECMWQDGDGSSPAENEIASIADYWFQKSRLKPPQRPFQDYKFYMYDEDNKGSAYKRLIEAGGGCIVSDIRDASVIIRTKGTAAKEYPIPLPAGIPVESPLFISQIILRNRS